MSALHEILAVEQGLSETATRITKEVTKILSSKQSLFAGMEKHHAIFAEDQQHLVQAPEIVEVQSTVGQQLDFLSTHLIDYWNVLARKEEANQRASADIIDEDGVTIAKNVPAITLLSLEKKLTSLVGTINAIPTVDSAVSWAPAEDAAIPGIYRTINPVERQQTVQTSKWVEVSPATPQFKAQLAEVADISIIGKFTVTSYSGALTPLEKAKRLEKITKLIRAVKTARQRANQVDVDNSITTGANIANYLFNQRYVIQVYHIEPTSMLGSLW